MHFEYLFSPANIRQANNNLTVKPSWSQQCWIKHIGTVSCGNNNNAVVGFKTVHLYQQLVECLFALVVATTKTGTTMPPHGINLIDKDDARRLFFRLLKHVAHTRGANTNKHFYKVGA